jgi:hypothetical protein
MAGRKENTKIMAVIKIKSNTFNEKNYLEPIVIGGPEKTGPRAAGWATLTYMVKNIINKLLLFK